MLSSAHVYLSKGAPMTFNDAILAIIILLMLVYAIYDEFIQHLLKGKTLLKINLKRKHRIDAII
ncbi:DUF986 family protein, partial [Providencia rettgeri]|nr:DUF986 family protein [Providencia rettgeri]